MLVEVVSYNGAFVEGDESVPGFRGAAEVKDVCERERRNDLQLELVGEGEEELVERYAGYS